MKYFCLLPLMLLYLSGCAQSAKQHPPIKGKIPVDGRRWYQLTNATGTLEDLFDGLLEQKPNTGYNKLIPHYESWYTLYKGEQMTIDSVLFFCYRGMDAGHPVRLQAVTADGVRTTIATFTGAIANSWCGPNPLQPQQYALKTPASGFRYLILDSWGEWPAEMELYGSYTPPAPIYPLKRKIPLRNYFGINTYEWDFENPSAPDVPDAGRLPVYEHFSAVRHYLDWEKLEFTPGNYTFNPARNGRWNYDTFYQYMHHAGKEILACIKTIPPWLQQTYPEGSRNNENIPAPYGADLNNPAAYTQQAKLAFQFAARYGSNSNIADTLLHVDTTPSWPGGPANIKRKGLGTVHYMECDNERDKWWKGVTAYQTGRAYAANLSAFYDGHKGTLGRNAGVKNADPAMQVVMAGLANPDPGYVQGIADWSAANRGYRKDGSIDLPFDVINYHFYCNDANGTAREATTGSAPEATNAAQVARAFTTLAARLGNIPVWVTETGYDINAGSPQRAPATAGKTAEEVQADWLVRTALLYARNGIDRMFCYQLYDDRTGGTERYATSGLINADRSPRLAARYFRQLDQLWGGFYFDTLVATQPAIDRYTNGQEIMYAVAAASGTRQGQMATIQLPGCDSARICQLNAHGTTMLCTAQAIQNNAVSITVSASPVFIIGVKKANHNYK